MTADWTSLRGRLRSELDRVDASAVLIMVTDVLGPEPPRPWWRRRRFTAPPDYYLAQFLGAPRGDTITVFLAGSTLIGGSHEIDEATHQRILDAGWTAPGDRRHVTRAGGDYGRFATMDDSDGLDSLAGAVVTVLDLLGATPELPWKFELRQ